MEIKHGLEDFIDYLNESGYRSVLSFNDLRNSPRFLEQFQLILGVVSSVPESVNSTVIEGRFVLSRPFIANRLIIRKGGEVTNNIDMIGFGHSCCIAENSGIITSAIDDILPCILQHPTRALDKEDISQLQGMFFDVSLLNKQNSRAIIIS